uniref:TauD/TfdA-like domain-containing protein n=1 Tax=Chenopodium quinoa TaxID=63459 RepID=A0A803MLW3_CHEQI
MAEFFTEIQLPQQKHYNNHSIHFPLILSPTFNFSFIDAIKSHKKWLDSRLHSAGAILFRDFPVSTAADFNDVVEAFGYEEFPYVGGAAPRSSVVGRVPEFPSKLFFYCEVEPKTGGETPIVLSHIIYERMKEKHPEFVQELEEHGLMYIRVLGEGDNPASPIGRGWKSTFLTDDKSVAEKRAAKLGMKLEWLEDGVKTIMGPIPAIKYNESRQRKVWFNSMVAAYTGWEDDRNDPVKAVTFGDGRPLPAEVVYDCLKILEEESVAIPWKKGDVLLIDNWAVLHSRRSFDPPRRVLASLCK